MKMLADLAHADASDGLIDDPAYFDRWPCSHWTGTRCIGAGRQFGINETRLLRSCPVACADARLRGSDDTNGSLAEDRLAAWRRREWQRMELAKAFDDDATTAAVEAQGHSGEVGRLNFTIVIVTEGANLTDDVLSRLASRLATAEDADAWLGVGADPSHTAPSLRSREGASPESRLLGLQMSNHWTPPPPPFPWLAVVIIVVTLIVVGLFGAFVWPGCVKTRRPVQKEAQKPLGRGGEALEVQIPEGASPGMLLSVVSADGAETTVVVPAGAKAGMTVLAPIYLPAHEEAHEGSLEAHEGYLPAHEEAAAGGAADLTDVAPKRGPAHAPAAGNLPQWPPPPPSLAQPPHHATLDDENPAHATRASEDDEPSEPSSSDQVFTAQMAWLEGQSEASPESQRAGTPSSGAPKMSSQRRFFGRKTEL